MTTHDYKWSKSRYLRLMAKEYLLRAIRKKTDSYRLRYERDAMFPRRTPEFLLEYVDDWLKDSMSVLDIACGEGALLDDLKKRSLRAFGIDISPIRVQRAVSRGRDVVVADMLQLPYRRQSFDLVIASGILQQTSTPDVALSQWTRVLKDEGTLLLMLDDIRTAQRNWLTTPGQRWKTVAYWSQYRVKYDESGLIKVIEASGLHIEKFNVHEHEGHPVRSWVAVCKKRPSEGKIEK